MKFQAVLPMQGKPMNALRASEKKVAANTLFAALITALGAGSRDSFDLAQCRTTAFCSSSIRTPTAFTAARC